MTNTSFGIVPHCRAAEGIKILKITLLKWISVGPTQQTLLRILVQKYGNECLILKKTTFGIVPHCRAAEGRKILKITLLKCNSVGPTQQTLLRIFLYKNMEMNV